MPKATDLSKGFVAIQARVSKGRSPDLYAHLVHELQKGESPGAVLRRLAEEALMLRGHPIIKSLQAVDLKGESKKSFINTTPAVNERQKEPLITKVGELSAPDSPKGQNPPPQKAPASGSQQMASILASRVPSTGAPRG